MSGEPINTNEAAKFIRYLADVSAAVGFQAGVGGMETAGAIVSFLAANPDYIGTFLDNGFLSLPMPFHERGELTWHGQNGKIWSPTDAVGWRKVQP